MLNTMSLFGRERIVNIRKGVKKYDFGSDKASTQEAGRSARYDLEWTYIPR